MKHTKMKHTAQPAQILLLGVVILSVTIWALPLSTYATEPMILDELQYKQYGQGITITGYQGDGGEVVVPSEVDGIPVTAIGTKAFAGC